MQRRSGRWGKIVLGVLLLVVVTLTVLLLNINTIARSQINKALDRYLVAGGNLEAIDVHLLAGKVVLAGLVIHPPPGFEPHPLLSLDKVEVEVAPWSLFKGTVVVEDLSLKGLLLNIVRDKKGRLSPLELVVEEVPDPVSPSEKEQEETASIWIPVVHVNTFEAADLSFRLVDRMLQNDWSASLKADLKVQGVQLADLLNLDILVERVDLKLNDILVDQPPGFSREPLLAVNGIEVASRDIDFKAPSVPVADVILDTLNISLERNTDREINVINLVQSWLPDKSISSSSTAAPPAAVSIQSSDSGFKIPVVAVDNIQLNSISAQVLDSIEGKPWRAGFDGLDIQVAGLKVADLARQAVSLASLNLDLKGISVDQPPGYSDTPLLSMGSFKLSSRGIDLGESTVLISGVGLDTLSVSVERNTDNEVNLLKLKESWLPALGEGGNNLSAPAPPASPDPVIKIPAVVVDDVKLKSISAQLLAFIEGHHWRAGFDDLDIHITGLEAGERIEQAMSLASFDLNWKGIAVDQPPGFGNSKLVGLEQFTIISGRPERPGTELVIEQVMLQGLTSAVTMRADGVTNLQVLKEALLGKDRADQPVEEEPIVEQEAPSSAPDRQPILVEQISLDGGPVTYRDEAFAEEPLEATLSNIQMDAKGLHLFKDTKDVKPASAALSFEFSQPGDLPTGYFGSLYSVGPLGDGVPMVNSQVRLVGLKLDTLGSLVPPATRATLGATGLDAGAALAMDSDSINLVAGALTDRGIKYKGLRVQGPLTAPIVQPGPLLTGVLSRVSDGLVNMGKGGFKASVDIAEGGVEGAKELGTGAVKVGANLGKSLFDTAAGVVTFDKEKVKAGAQGSTKGTVGLTTDSVKGSGQAAGGSLKSSTSNLKGENRVKAWEQDIPARYEASMEHARTVLADMPYPPVTE